jgi:dihydrofolate reductase
MGKLVSTIFVTLDGVYQGPGGPEEDTRGGFEHGGWSFVYGDDDFGRFVVEVFDRSGAYLLGRRTYDIFAGYWPDKTDPADPVASKLNALPKYVASSTLTDPSWAGTTVIGGDLAKEVTDLKERTEGELQVHGSGALARELMQDDLIDEYRLLTYPVVLGTGRRLFADGARPAALRLVDTSTTSTGVTMSVYEPAGEPAHGSFELPQQ